jgi:hypothetical protein
MIVSRQNWDTFKKSFNELGSERRGMTPLAAAALMAALALQEKTRGSSFTPYKHGPIVNIPNGEKKVVDITTDYAGCSEFWDKDYNHLRAKITQAAKDYVAKHFEVFRLLKP